MRHSQMRVKSLNFCLVMMFPPGVPLTFFQNAFLDLPAGTRSAIGAIGSPVDEIMPVEEHLPALGFLFGSQGVEVISQEWQGKE